MTQRTEEQYLDQLMQIEFAVLGFFDDHPELTDAVVLVVSEERGSMRIALGGRLGPDLNGAELREKLRELVYEQPSPPSRTAPPAPQEPGPAEPAAHPATAPHLRDDVSETVQERL